MLVATGDSAVTTGDGINIEPRSRPVEGALRHRGVRGVRVPHAEAALDGAGVRGEGDAAVDVGVRVAAGVAGVAAIGADAGLSLQRAAAGRAAISSWPRKARGPMIV